MRLMLRRCIAMAVTVIVLTDAFLSVYFNGTQRWNADTRDYVLIAIGFCLVLAVLFFSAALLGLRDPEDGTIPKEVEPGDSG